MRPAFHLAALLCALAVPARAAEDVLDRVEEALTFGTPAGEMRGRLSGTLDLEGYAFSTPAPALLHTAGSALFSPRLTVFLDAQLGGRVYLFAQARADRGFDPGNRPVRPRLDEYAVRFSPWRDGRLHLQAGKFASVVGNWIPRHGSWANPFVTAPLPYEHLTGIWDNAAARSATILQEWAHLRPATPRLDPVADKTQRLPIVWGPSYATGAAVSGVSGKFNYAAEVKHASLSSRPGQWSAAEVGWSHPTVSGRLGYRPGAAWHLGLSASGGSYLRRALLTSLPAGRGRGDYRQLVVAQDASFAWRHFQLWTEVFAARFEVPLVGDADTVAYYAEAKHKFTPRAYGAVRWNQQWFGDLPDRGAKVPWGRDIWRLDLAGGFRFTAHTQLKLQYSLGREPVGARDFSHLFGAQLTARF